MQYRKRSDMGRSYAVPVVEDGSSTHPKFGGKRSVFGTMMDSPLLVSSLLWRAENVFGDRVNVSCDGGLPVREFTYKQMGESARRLAGALLNIGVGAGSRVGSLAWNSDLHLTAYFAVPGIGAVLHTINHRLSDEQLIYSINAAEDEVLLVDRDLVPVIEPIWGELRDVKQVIVFGDSPVSELPQARPYTQFVEEAAPISEWPELDELRAASICFTSGTTGRPKGVAYSHRSTVLHALAICAAGGVGIAHERSYLLGTQMSHVNGWGVPYAAALQGARLVLPGTHPSASDFLSIVTSQGPDTFIGSPTIAAMMRDEYRENPNKYDLSELQTLWLGGQAPPEELVAWWAGNDTVTVNGWGMTETSPMGTFSHGHLSQGKPLPLFEVRICAPDGSVLSWDGKSTGELEVRSPWVTATYFNEPFDDSFCGGWLRTGDVARVTQAADIQVRDRYKDLVKSGGEWISSVELESHLALHPAVAEAAVIAIPSERWGERPVAWIITAGEVSDHDLVDHVRSRFPNYWVPDQFYRVDEIPKTSVGKVDKQHMRTRTRDHDL